MPTLHQLKESDKKPDDGALHSIKIYKINNSSRKSKSNVCFFFYICLHIQEANSTFRILLNESTRRLKLLSKKLGSCIEKARPFYEAQEKARLAQIECQAAAVKFQRANGKSLTINCVFINFNCKTFYAFLYRNICGR